MNMLLLLPTSAAVWITVSLALLLGAMESASADPTVRAFAGSDDVCFVSGRGEREGIPLALGLALGSAAIRSSLPALGRYLANAANSTSSPILTAISDADLFRIRSHAGRDPELEMNLECIVVTSGVFGELDVRRFPQGYWENFDPDGLFTKRNGGQIDLSTIQKLGLLDLPMSYLEFRIERHPSGEAFRLKPVVSYFRATSATRNTQNAKNIEVTVTITKPSPTGALDANKSTENNGLIAQIPIVLRHLNPGRTRRAPVTNFETVWIAEPRLPSEEQTRAATKLVGSPGALLTLGPANIFVTYREVDEPDLMLHILASIVSENSGQISSALEEALRTLATKGK
jgi:hypothetical protein